MDGNSGRRGCASFVVLTLAGYGLRKHAVGHEVKTLNLVGRISGVAAQERAGNRVKFAYGMLT